MGITFSKTLIISNAWAGAMEENIVEEPNTYRDTDYRSPVPATLKGAIVISSEAANTLWKSKEWIFIDVLPTDAKPENLPKGTIWRDKKRLSIPGSMWLPNVGYGKIPKDMDDYFRANLDTQCDNNKNCQLVFFCLDECWMSWNAAKRAVEYGYKKVRWYPEGTDGWSFYDYPLEEIKPVPGFQ